MMVIDMTDGRRSELTRMFEMKEWDVQEAAREWLRDNQAHRRDIANLVREVSSVTRQIIAADRSKAPRAYELRRRMYERILEEHGRPLRPTYDDLIDAAVTTAGNSSYTAEREYFARNPSLPCGLQDSATEKFAIGRRLAQLYMAAAMML